MCVGLILGPVVRRRTARAGDRRCMARSRRDRTAWGSRGSRWPIPSRPAGSVRAGAAGPASADRARRIGVHIWYPARRGAGARPLTLRDYFSVHQGANDGLGDPDRVAVLRRFLARFGTVSDAAFAALTATPLLAVRDAVPAPERFPLVIGLLRPVATTITNEFLASHGYVVAMVSGDQTPEPADAGRALEIPLRDMEFAIPHLRKLPYVAPAGLATLGFSGSGFSQILLGMRHPDVDAVCDLESAIFDDGVLWPLSRGWGYDLAALRMPFLHTYSVPLSRRENRRADFEGMRYSTRFHYLVDAPGIDHADFATEGMVASVMPGLRGDQAPRLRQAFETHQSLRARVLRRVREARSARPRVPARRADRERRARWARHDPRAAGDRARADAGRLRRARHRPRPRRGPARVPPRRAPAIRTHRSSPRRRSTGLATACCATAGRRRPSPSSAPRSIASRARSTPWTRSAKPSRPPAAAPMPPISSAAAWPSPPPPRSPPRNERP